MVNIMAGNDDDAPAGGPARCPVMPWKFPDRATGPQTAPAVAVVCTMVISGEDTLSMSALAQDLRGGGPAGACATTSRTPAAIEPLLKG